MLRLFVVYTKEEHFVEVLGGFLVPAPADMMDSLRLPVLADMADNLHPPCPGGYGG
ncbi:hypothetical protein GCM10020331_068710 [Ectobacillus funiculus]